MRMILLSLILTLGGIGIFLFTWKVKPQLRDSFNLSGILVLVTAINCWIDTLVG